MQRRIPTVSDKDRSALGIAVTAAKEIPTTQIIARAEDGDAYYQGLLALFYSWGQHGFAKDYDKAKNWATRSALQSHPFGEYSLAFLPYEFTEHHTSNSIAEAEAYLQLCFPKMKTLAEQGDMTAQSLLARMYWHAHGTTTDRQASAAWSHKAALQGDSPSQMTLGYLYYSGHILPKDLHKAAQWFKIAADNGNTNALQAYEDIMKELADEKMHNKANEGIGDRAH